MDFHHTITPHEHARATFCPKTPHLARHQSDKGGIRCSSVWSRSRFVGQAHSVSFSRLLMVAGLWFLAFLVFLWLPYRVFLCLPSFPARAVEPTICEFSLRSTRNRRMAHHTLNWWGGYEETNSYYWHRFSYNTPIYYLCVRKVRRAGTGRVLSWGYWAFPPPPPAYDMILCRLACFHCRTTGNCLARSTPGVKHHGKNSVTVLLFEYSSMYPTCRITAVALLIATDYHIIVIPSSDVLLQVYPLCVGYFLSSGLALSIPGGHGPGVAEGRSVNQPIKKCAERSPLKHNVQKCCYDITYYKQ